MKDDNLKRKTISTLLAIICIPLQAKFCVAPPILVAFTEFTNPKSLESIQLKQLVSL